MSPTAVDIGSAQRCQHSSSCGSSASGNTHRLLFAWGGNQVGGVTHECDYPHEAQDLPKSRATCSSQAWTGRDRHGGRDRTAAGESIYELDDELGRELEPIYSHEGACHVAPYGRRVRPGAGRFRAAGSSAGPRPTARPSAKCARSKAPRQGDALDLIPAPPTRGRVRWRCEGAAAARCAWKGWTRSSCGPLGRRR